MRAAPRLTVVGSGPIADGYTDALMARRGGSLAARVPASTYMDPLRKNEPEDHSDGYVVSASAEAAAAVVRSLVTHNRPVLLDPPWVFAEGLDVAEPFSERGLVLWHGRRHRQDATARRIAYAVLSGRLGEPLVVRLSRPAEGPAGDDTSWAGMGVALDLVSWWIHARARRLRVLTAWVDDEHVQQRLQLSVEFHGGAHALCTVAPEAAGTGAMTDAMVVGRDATLTVPWDSAGPIIADATGRRHLPVPYHGYGSELRDWWTAVGACRAAPGIWDEQAAHLAVIRAARQSALSEQLINIRAAVGSDADGS